jgi:ATP-dependent 26S proteasome regulatory subunit
MLEIVNQLDGFDARGNIKVLMATNRLVKLATIMIHDHFSA